MSGAGARHVRPPCPACTALVPGVYAPHARHVRPPCPGVYGLHASAPGNRRPSAQQSVRRDETLNATTPRPATVPRRPLVETEPETDHSPGPERLLQPIEQRGRFA